MKVIHYPNLNLSSLKINLFDGAKMSQIQMTKKILLYSYILNAKRLYPQPIIVYYFPFKFHDVHLIIQGVNT